MAARPLSGLAAGTATRCNTFSCGAVTPTPYLTQVRPSRAIDTSKARLAPLRIHAAPSPRLARGDH
ncbi:hypothetical protein PR003_g3276 [Phytophthora rubi]|uniref:Uncharacterized protein n=1 Tax=Phytophthora rubi TaxID=129364 RepID=A0A6A3NUQ8_9STRA|nr:hypothetical protein PR002_g3609 [Phytophthora rubi]KAE9049242.1 hypothetical protein PR001_g3494 [Phytophthora rubi]KAE9354614.1 hypothetical protein PR003_g3276 [Phytophthora rubi]